MMIGLKSKNHGMWWKSIMILWSVVAWGVIVDASQVIMKDMTKNFLKAYEQCKDEYHLTDDTATELMYFWKEGFEVKSRLAGCAIMCLSHKLEILDPEGKIHKGKTTDFVKQHGGDEGVAQKVIDILHTCESSTTPVEDKCIMALNIAMCFKKHIHELNWAPDPQVLMEEMMAEME